MRARCSRSKRHLVASAEIITLPKTRDLRYFSVMQNTLSGLLRKRSELAGIVEGLQDQPHKSMIEMDHIDCTIRLFQPEIDLEELKVKPIPPRHAAFKGQVTRAILEMLREATGPMEGEAITLALMEDRALNTSDKRLVKTMRKRIGAALRHLRERRLVVLP